MLPDAASGSIVSRTLNVDEHVATVRSAVVNSAAYPLFTCCKHTLVANMLCAGSALPSSTMAGPQCVQPEHGRAGRWVGQYMRVARSLQVAACTLTKIQGIR